ncbi:MAG: DUF4367 domain-containing protein [Clostridia bacterium]|nr:DUF4367 domain-containing protein [Clostridia bacterium]
MNNSYKKAMDKIELSDDLKEKIINNTSKPTENKKIKPVYIGRIAGLAACFVLCFLSYLAVTNFHTDPDTDVVVVDIPNPIPDNEQTSKKVAINEPLKDTPSLKTIPKGSEETKTSQPPVYKENEINDKQIEEALPKNDTVTENNPTATGSGLPTFIKAKENAEDGKEDKVIKKSTVEEVSAILGYEIKTPQTVPEGYTTSDVSLINSSIVEIQYHDDDDIITYRTAKTSSNLSPADKVYEYMEIVNINSVDVVVKGTEDLYYNAVWFDAEESFSITSNHGVEKQVIIDMISSGDYTLEPNMEKEI